MIDPIVVAHNADAIRKRIIAAGGPQVTLIAVTKTFGIDAIRAVVDAGCSAIGENYAQELIGKVAEWPEGVALPEVHFIGRLQSNKIRMLAPHVDVWQTVDRPSIVDELARRAPGARIFVQVNVDDDPAKGGCTPGETPMIVSQAVEQGLVVDGLMTIGRQGSIDEVSAGFVHLRALADRLGLVGCSMGMSGDLEAAVGAGATHVRVGSALFGPRIAR